MSNSPFQSNNKGLTKRWAAWQPRPANGSGPRPVSLKDFDPDATPFMDGEKAQGKEDVQALAIELDALQNLLYADRRYKLLVLLQGTDASGKDGTVRGVFGSMSALGVHAVSWKAPTEPERAHDYLWRIHQRVPGAGELTVFNRSHYEDVLVTHVRGWIDETEQTRRIRQINDFERMLAETGTTIVKIFLNISNEAQRERLQERLDNPEKHWKFNPGDLEDRKLWPQFMQTYQQVIAATDTDHAPWYIVPADSKSGRSLIIVNILLEHLRKLHLAYPEVDTSGWPQQIE